MADGSEQPGPRAAATIALLRPGPDGVEVLLTHRPATMEFGPGLHVFPGGAVDPGDDDPRLVARSVLSADACARAWAGDMEPAAAVAHHIAGLRELFEETGVLLATGPGGAAIDPEALDRVRGNGLTFAELVERLDLVLRTDALVPLSRWVTPPAGMARRYDARFFAASLPDGARPAMDDREVAAYEWVTPRAALAAMTAGRMALWPPTSTTLQQLSQVRKLEDVRRHLTPMAPAAPPAVDVIRPGLVRVRLRGAGGVPGQEVNAWVIGSRRMVVVDPGEPDDAAAEAFLDLAAARGGRIEAILLTAPVPDHAAGATSLAVRIGAPVHAAAGAAAVLPGEFVTLEDGDQPDLSETRIRVHATPGTHPDHLAFELPDDREVLVGDLFGPGPSRAMPQPADEAALRRSLERIEGLRPLALRPAHGRGRGPAEGRQDEGD